MPREVIRLLAHHDPSHGGLVTYLPQKWSPLLRSKSATWKNNIKHVVIIQNLWHPSKIWTVFPVKSGFPKKLLSLNMFWTVLILSTNLANFRISTLGHWIWPFASPGYPTDRRKALGYIKPQWYHEPKAMWLSVQSATKWITNQTKSPL